MGYSPYIGFIHKGSPLPLTYDLADLYKENLCIDLAFSWPVKYRSEERSTIVNAFIERCIEKRENGNLSSHASCTENDTRQEKTCTRTAFA